MAFCYIINAIQWRRWYVEAKALNSSERFLIDYRKMFLDNKVINSAILAPGEQGKLRVEVTAWLREMERLQQQRETWFRSMPSKLRL